MVFSFVEDLKLATGSPGTTNSCFESADRSELSQTRDAAVWVYDKIQRPTGPRIVGEISSSSCASHGYKHFVRDRAGGVKQYDDKGCAVM